MVKKVKGCTHIVIRNGKIANIFTHLSDFPKEGVIHLKSDETYSIEEFKQSHPRDNHELKKHRKIVNTGQF
jgi:hypothetical protein